MHELCVRFRSLVRSPKLHCKYILTRSKRFKENGMLPIGWIEQPTSPLRVARSTTELNGRHYLKFDGGPDLFPKYCRPCGEREVTRPYAMRTYTSYTLTTTYNLHEMTDENNTARSSRSPFSLPSNSGPRIGRVGAWGAGSTSSRYATCRILPIPANLTTTHDQDQQ